MRNGVGSGRTLLSLSAMLFAVLPFLLVVQSAYALATKSVLVLYSNNRLVPGNVAVDHGIAAALVDEGDRPVQTYSEFLDHPEFSGDTYENLVVAYLHGKYAASPPDAIIAVSDDALSFVVRHRAQLFPAAPVVYAVVSTPLLRTIGPIPADIVGVPNDYDFSGTIAQALKWHPNARRLVLIMGTSTRDKKLELRLRGEVSAVVGSAIAEFWSGL